jgi:predicted DNA-binding WGR domain protein
MDAILLHRIDAAKNMRRFYRLDVALELFGRWCLVAEWGRIGHGGRLRMTAYENAAEAQEALARQRHAKERRGYRLVNDYARRLKPAAKFGAPDDKAG